MKAHRYFRCRYGDSGNKRLGIVPLKSERNAADMSVNAFTHAA